MASVQPDDNFNGMAALRSSHPHIIHLPPAASTSQPFVIDLNTVEMGGMAPPSGGEDGAAPQNAPRNNTVGTALPSLRTLIKPFEGSLPFLLIVLFKALYDHRLGILMFLAMFGTFFHTNSNLRKFVAQREAHNTTESLGSLLWLVGALVANILCVYLVFDDQKLYRSLYLVCPDVEHFTLWTLLWVTGTTDFVVKFITMIIKAVIALVPRQVMPLKKKGKWYMMVETLSQSYRSILPITPWIYYIFDDEHTGRWFSVILFVAYVACKAYNLLAVYRMLRTAMAKFRVDTSFGSLPSRSQIESYDNSCPICQDKFTDPVALSCTHVFCEECVATWFNRERTCPMCRANIVDMPLWRDGSTSANLQIY